MKNPRYEPSLHCRSGLTETYFCDFPSAATGPIPAPNEDVEVTAVPANSTPIAPAPVSGLYLVQPSVSVEDCEVWRWYWSCHSNLHTLSQHPLFCGRNVGLTSQVADPIRMGVSGKNDCVINFRAVEMVKNPVLFSTIAVPCVLDSGSENERQSSMVHTDAPRRLHRV